MDHPMPLTPRVSRITIGRLFNLGNYEHIRYEITVDVPPEADAGETLQELETILNDLRAKGGSEYEVDQARAVLAKPAGELSRWDAENLATYQEKVRRHDEALEKRRRAREALTQLGGSISYVDAKDQWEDDP